jgi:hypothetical protein
MNEENKIEEAKTILSLFCFMSKQARGDFIIKILDEQAENKDVVVLVRNYLELIHVKIALSDASLASGEHEENSDQAYKLKEVCGNILDEFISEYTRLVPEQGSVRFKDEEGVILGYLLRYSVRGGKK